MKYLNFYNKVLLLSLLGIWVFHVKAGVDFIRYMSILETFEFSAYYVKNIFSWGFIYFSRALTESPGGVSLVITAVLLTIIKFSEIKKSGDKFKFVLILVLISPVGVLLSLNVLRQYIALVFLFMSFYFWMKAAKKRGVFFAFIAIISHEVVLFYISFYVLYSVLYRFLEREILIALAIAVVMLSLTFVMPKFVVIGDDANKFYGYMAYVTVLIFSYATVIRFSNNFYDKRKMLKIMLYIFITLNAFFIMNSLPVWVLNRMLISLSFIILFLIYSSRCYTKGGKCFYIKTGTLIFNILALLMHDGAMDMLELV